MRKHSFFLALVSLVLLPAASLSVASFAQDRSEAQSQAAGRPQANSQSQSQSISQSQSQAQSQATSQATSQAISQQTNSQIQSDSSSQTMPGMDMRMSDANQTAAQEVPDGGQGSADAMQSMEDHHMDMGPHMKMTALRPMQPGDEAKAADVVEAARKVALRYADYRDALANGYHIFLPNVPQKQYHFTNSSYGLEAAYRFNPDHPTSLLYQKEGDGYKLVGVMYTARKHATEEELNERIPLSIAQWHAHVNFCLPPFGSGQLMSKNTQFGMRGSIATKEACDAAGGRFIPQVFGWMVHVYPFEKNQADIWAVERQAPGHMD